MCVCSGQESRRPRRGRGGAAAFKRPPPFVLVNNLSASVQAAAVTGRYKINVTPKAAAVHARKTGAEGRCLCSPGRKGGGIL